MEESEIESWYEDQKRMSMEKFAKLVNKHRELLIKANTAESFKSKEATAQAELAALKAAEDHYKWDFLDEMDKIKRQYRRMHENLSASRDAKDRKKRLTRKYFGPFIDLAMKVRQGMKESAEQRKIEGKRAKLRNLVYNTMPKKRKRLQASFRMARNLKPIRRFYYAHLFPYVDWFERPIRRRYEKISAAIVRATNATIRFSIKSLLAALKSLKLMLAKTMVFLQKIFGVIGKGFSVVGAAIKKLKGAIAQLFAKKTESK